MPTDARAQLEGTVLDVVERYAYMFGEPSAPSALPRPSGPVHGAAMSVRGGVQGTLTLVLPAQLLTAIAANVLGLDPEDVHPGETTGDAMREMLNVIGGHVVPVLVGEQAEFSLEPPREDAAIATDWEVLAGRDGTCGFLLDGEPVLLGITIDRAAG
jgi:hypothetical protein